MRAGLRPLAIWRNMHDNGWVANAVENSDGTFAAWAAPDVTSTAIADYVEDGPENATRAAEFALAKKSGTPSAHRSARVGAYIFTSQCNEVLA